MAIGNYLNLRLFLEGIEVPVISAAVQAAANTPASATVQVIASDRVMDLMPRTVVHIFYYDYVAANNPVLDARPKETDSADYKLLFCGEVQAVSINKGHGSRAAVLTCVDLSNYWDTTFQYNFHGSLFAGRSRAAFIGGNSTLFNSPLGHGVGTISALLNQRSKNFPKMTGLLAGVVRLLEAIGGWYRGSGAFRGVNDFASIAELRLKLLQQVAAAESDTSSAKLFARKAFNGWMRGQIGQLGTVVSFRTIAKLLFQFIFHECYPCPVPRFIAGTETIEKRRYSVPLSKIKNAGLIKAVEDADAAVAAARSILFGSASDLVQAKADAAAFRNYTQLWGKSFLAVSRVEATAQVSNIQAIHRHVARARTAARKIKTLQEGAARQTTQGNISGNFAAIKAEYAKIRQALAAILGTRLRGTYEKKNKTYDRLHTQFFRPDVFFAPPPRCNVLFPEWYSSMQYQRNFFREVTRMELQTSNEILGNSGLFNGRYYAPDVADVRTGVKLSSRRFARTIMEHELYTGIIPVFQQMSEANIYAMRAGKIERGAQKVPYAQRAVNFLYFKQRFAARTLSAGGHFNPNVIPGLPVLLIDRPMPSDKLKVASAPTGAQLKELGLPATATQEELLRKMVPPQYLGVCAQLSHVVGQRGGQSSYQLMHARVHREDTEFLGVDKAAITKRDGTATRLSQVAAAAAFAPKKGDKGPYGGKILSVRDITGRTKRKLRVLGTDLRVVPGERMRVGNDKGLSFAQKYHVLKEREPMRGYEIVESVTAWRKVMSDLPIEDAIALPWIWDGWKNPKVTKTYREMFGTSAITDVGGFTAPTMSSGGKRSYAGVDLVLSSSETPTVESSVDDLVRGYSFSKANGMDMGEFLRVYSWRPVATMVDMFGEDGLKIVKKDVKKTVRVRQRVRAKAEAGKSPAHGYRVVTREVTVPGYEVQGKEGFHSRAFGDEEDLFGLVNPTVHRVLGLSRRRTKVAARMDVRKRRRAVVRAYVADLVESRGLLG